MRKILISVPLALALLFGCASTAELPVQKKPTKSATSKAPNTKYTPRHKTTNKVAPKPTPTKTNSKMYTSCKQAFDARHVPVRKGEPEYNPRLDGDKDGLACEH